MTASDMFRLLKAHAGTALRVVRSSEMLRAMPIALMRFDSHRHHNQGEQAEAYSAASLGLCTAQRFSNTLAYCFLVCASVLSRARAPPRHAAAAAAALGEYCRVREFYGILILDPNLSNLSLHEI